MPGLFFALQHLQHAYPLPVPSVLGQCFGKLVERARGVNKSHYPAGVSGVVSRAT